MLDFYSGYVEVNDPLHWCVRHLTGDTPPFNEIPDDFLHFDEKLPILTNRLALPKFKGSKNIFVVGIFDASGPTRQSYANTGLPRYQFIAKAAPWVMRSVLQNTDASKYKGMIDFGFLIEKHIWEEVAHIFRACGVSEKHIILAEITDAEAYVHPVQLKVDGFQRTMYSCAKTHPLIFSERMRHYEQVIWHGADVFVARRKEMRKFRLFEHLLGKSAGNLEKPKFIGGWGNRLPPQLNEWSTAESINVRDRYFSRESFIRVFSEATGIPLEESKELCRLGTSARWAGGTFPAMRWCVKHYVENYPERVNWINKWMRHEILGPDHELGMISVFAYYLKNTEGIDEFVEKLDSNVCPMYLERSEKKQYLQNPNHACWIK